MNSFCKTASEKQNCLAIQITKIVCFLIIFGLSVFIITQNMKPQIKKNQNFLSNVTDVESHNTDLETDQSEEFELIQVITMTRHGTTTPGLLFPNDPNREEWARVGPPETLTHKGVREHCELGRYLARRYGQFITGRVTHNKKTKIWRSGPKALLKKKNFSSQRLTKVAFNRFKNDSTAFLIVHFSTFYLKNQNKLL